MRSWRSFLNVVVCPPRNSCGGEWRCWLFCLRFSWLSCWKGMEEGDRKMLHSWSVCWRLLLWNKRNCLWLALLQHVYVLTYIFSNHVGKHIDWTTIGGLFKLPVTPSLFLSVDRMPKGNLCSVAKKYNSFEVPFMLWSPSSIAFCNHSFILMYDNLARCSLNSRTYYLNL